MTLTDYRPISLIHNFAKLISKLLANRLGPHLEQMISVNQTAFIQKRCIQDNFIYVQQVIRDLHKSKTPAFFIKLDISKAFDTVSWTYLLHIMSHLGFGQRWRCWISSLWCTASSSFLLNGDPGRRILHCRGVRQGDPLSPMLFLLAMEPLYRLFKKAQEWGLLGPLRPGCDTFRVSLYVDDAAVFLRPNKQELQVFHCILNIFGQASGLITNLEKTEYYPIQSQTTNLQFMVDAQHSISQFPCKYLGLPLHTRKPTRASWDLLIQKVGDRLPEWKRRFFTYPGR